VDQMDRVGQPYIPLQHGGETVTDTDMVFETADGPWRLVVRNCVVTQWAPVAPIIEETPDDIR